MADNRYVDYEYDTATDKLGRITQRKDGNGTAPERVTSYTYVAGDPSVAGSTTSLIESITQPGLNLSYTYDDVGNILTEVKNDKTTSYVYDKLGQLTRVNDPNESATWVYDYDCGGNILSKKKYAYTTGAPAGTPVSYAHTYGNASWKDQLTSFNGKAITYDVIGNPLTYDGWTYTWEKGRQLKKMVKGTTTIEYAYDVAGLRIQKKVNGIATDYTLHGKLVIAMKTGNDTLHFFYDAQSRPTMVKYGEAYYNYQHNMQGDIIAILDAAGNKVVEYAYDAWGRPISTTGSMATTLGKLNPFRYRHYQYDEETSHHYLRSRYYNPEWGRFVNADSLIGKSGKLLSHNIFAYCKNSPVCLKDTSGQLWEYCISKESFATQVEAAVDFAERFNPSSIAENCEYSGCIFPVEENGEIRYKHFLGEIGNALEVNPVFSPEGYAEEVAFIHTHAAYNKEYNPFRLSDDDMAHVAIEEHRGKTMFLATPAGTLLAYKYIFLGMVDGFEDGYEKKHSYDNPLRVNLPFDPKMPVSERLAYFREIRAKGYRTSKNNVVPILP